MTEDTAEVRDIGPAAGLTQDELALRSGVAQPNIAAYTRNIAHRYEQIDYEIIWNTLVHRLPAEADQVRRILDGDAPELGSVVSGEDDE
ncbi:hypothetical protein EHH44_06460 [Mycolicibacter terrae]|uniref:Uncharacterized protein n=1 Tax=Mycolicibacter terrae TaxID=1788 RepID=A0ACD2EQL8_9MYCO|nr:HepT-like ribonuclease domain-containing protein [Mycolicibacter terrae]RRR47219.1 hypothetical protein EHH44_06460 [Mycolicibacter terrae]